MSETNVEIKNSCLTFKNGQGIELQGVLLSIDRHHVVFELYTPDAVLRASEVLTELRVVYQERPVYAGRAIVSALVNTGLMLVCEATLEDPWVDMNLAATGNNGDGLEIEFDRFMSEWQKLYRVQPRFKVAVADLQTYLTDLRSWLNQVEVGIRASPSADRAELERQLARKLENGVVSAITNLFDRLEDVAQQLPAEEQSAHWAYGKRQLHPLLLCSPFVYRTLRKPLGYAGDYEMVNMMFRDPCEGSSLFAKLVNMYALRLPPIVGHRSRIDYLVDTLEQETLAALVRKRPARFYSLGCGPAHEVQTFLSRPIADHAQFTLVDFNEETLRHTGQKIDALRIQQGRATKLEFVRKSVQAILKESSRRNTTATESYRMVCCAGLFDYLSDKVCRQVVSVLYSMVEPGGLLVITNVDRHPSRAEMECFLEWHLIYRNAEELQALVPADIPRDQVSHSTQDHGAGVNLFLEIRKPEL